MKYITTVGEREYVVEILDEKRILLDGKLYEVDFDSIDDQPVFSLLIDGRSFEAYVYQNEDACQVLLNGHSFPATVLDEREKLRPASNHPAKAPISADAGPDYCAMRRPASGEGGCVDYPGVDEDAE
jgi:hypothetical protein